MQNNSFDIENLPQPRVLESNDSEDLLHMLNADYSPAVIRGFANNWPLVNAAKHSDNALCEYLTSVASNAILPLIILPEAKIGRAHV